MTQSPAPKPTSAVELADLVVKSGLATQESLDKWLEGFRASDRSQTVAALAVFLVYHKVVTEWQCSKLCNGQWKGFFLDQYKILAHIGLDETHSRFLVEDIRTGTRVVMAVQGGTFPPQYIVEAFK